MYICLLKRLWIFILWYACKINERFCYRSLIISWIKGNIIISCCSSFYWCLSCIGVKFISPCNKFDFNRMFRTLSIENTIMWKLWINVINIMKKRNEWNYTKSKYGFIHSKTNKTFKALSMAFIESWWLWKDVKNCCKIKKLLGLYLGQTHLGF